MAWPAFENPRAGARKSIDRRRAGRDDSIRPLGARRDSELAVVSVDSFSTPALITRASPTTRKKFFEFFTVPIRNANTRAAYYRAIQQFLAWAERAGYQDLEDIEPITVAAYIEILQRRSAPPTVKQHMAAIRMLFSWLTEKGVLAMNPAREVKTERFSRDRRQNTGVC